MANIRPIIEVKVKVAWWLPAYLQTLKTLCEITGMEPNMERAGYWVSKALKAEVVTTLKRRPLHRRFINSYRSWRAYLGVWASLRAAWVVSRG